MLVNGQGREPSSCVRTLRRLFGNVFVVGTALAHDLVQHLIHDEEEHCRLLLIGHFGKIVTLCKRLKMLPNNIPHARCIFLCKLFLGRDVTECILISLHKTTSVNKSAYRLTHHLSFNQDFNNRLNICARHTHRIGNTSHRYGGSISKIQNIGFNIRAHK